MTNATTPIWKKPASVKQMDEMHRNTAVGNMGIEFLEIGADFVRARMPVDARTIQPYGLLHGGASVVLAETLGSSGAHLACPEGFIAVGLEINANHVRGVREGFVTGTARALHVGRTTQVWSIEIVNEAGDLVCVSRITMSVLKMPSVS
jgi:1,4-dihydroxy-2-naphthoyl-CoA hydrolase